MNRPVVETSLKPFFGKEDRGHSDKTLIVLHETVSPNKPGLSDILGVAAFLDSTGLEIHGILDKEGNMGWAYDRKAIYDHCASNGGNVNTNSVGIELVSEIPLLPTNAQRRAAWWDTAAGAPNPDRKRQLDELALWCAWLSTVEDIPLVYSNGLVPGITTHWSVSQSYNVAGGHWDCFPIHRGGHFPALYVVNRARMLRDQDAIEL